MTYINPVLLFSMFAVRFRSLLIIHASSGGVVARQARSERGRDRGKYVVLRLRGRGGNRGKLVSALEREWPKECAIVFVVELGGASIRDEGRGNMSDAIIPALKHRIPSELRS